MIRLGRSTLAALLVVAAGCGSGGDDAGEGDPEGSVSCTSDPRLDAYSGTLEKAGELGALSFRFSNFAPEQPSRGNNTFHVQVVDASGTAVSGDGADPASVSLGVSLFMPDHGHGTSVEPAVTFDAGQYTLAPLYLFMPGVWRIELDAQTGDAGEMLDRVVLHFCIEG
jgi:YtkA-like